MVEGDRDHDAAFVVPNGSPVRLRTVVSKRCASSKPPHPWNLPLLLVIVERVHDRVVVRYLQDGPVREHAPHALHEAVPFFGAPEIIKEQKATTQQIIAQLGALSVGQQPVPHLTRYEKRPFEDIITIFEVYRLLN